ncbi:YraN family protein [Rhodobacteraceae bacterium N5(2021)]|uniref:YraN family protein n=1 Tax=Gymnodinialimonas phycosphaerae TaxID=2841589 RepID=A0A975TTY3_9RHOB|nr:YraN family protein [Gymnodinialimonas phycosphaerae]
MRVYMDHGHRLVARRWRGPAGEIDLVMEKDGEVVFVEVKASRTHAQAAAALSQRQIGRLLRSAEHCLGSFPKGLATPMRFDVALIDGQGQFDVIVNALAA